MVGYMCLTTKSVKMFRCLAPIKGTCVRHHFSDLNVMIPLALICIHSKSTIRLLTVHFMYLWRALHYSELSVQSQGGPLLDCILHMCSTEVHGAYCNLILSVLLGHILTMINITL
jgi:hypothetical protein